MNVNMQVKLKDVRVTYPKLFVAEKMANGEGEPKFSAAFLIPKADPQTEAVKEAIRSVIKTRWATAAESVTKKLVGENKLCLHDGDLKGIEEYAGCYYVSASSKKKPKVFNRDKTPLDEDTGVIYGGCYVDAVITLWAQDSQYGQRVNASLEGVRFVRDGDAFGGVSRVTANDFDDLTVDDKADDDISDLL